MYCIKCGHEIPDKSKFCNDCGAVINTSTSDTQKRQSKSANKYKKPIIAGVIVTLLILSFFAIKLVTSSTFASNDIPSNVITKYLSASNLEDRLQYVLDAESIRPLMEKRYAVNPITSFSNFQVQKPNEIIEGDDSWIKVKVLYKNAMPFNFYLNKTNMGYKIDWKAYTGYNEINFTDFKARRPSEETVVRVLGKISDYYNYEFKDMQDAYLSIELNDSDGRLLFLNAYIPRATKQGKELSKILNDGQYHELLIGLYYDSNSNSNSSVVRISRFINEGWFDINEHKLKKNGPLLDAATNGDIDKVKLLLDSGIDVNTIDKYGNTPLLKAIANKRLDIVKVLLDKGADINIVNNITDMVANSPANDAILLLDQAKYDPDNQILGNALSLAMDANDTEIVKMLVDKGADVNMRDVTGIPVIFKAVDNNNVLLIRFLLDKGADFNATRINLNSGWNDESLLEAAQNKGFNNIVNILLEYGAK